MHMIISKPAGASCRADERIVGGKGDVYISPASVVRLCRCAGWPWDAFNFLVDASFCFFFFLTFWRGVGACFLFRKWCARGRSEDRTVGGVMCCD